MPRIYQKWIITYRFRLKASMILCEKNWLTYLYEIIFCTGAFENEVFHILLRWLPICSLFFWILSSLHNRVNSYYCQVRVVLRLGTIHCPARVFFDHTLYTSFRDSNSWRNPSEIRKWLSRCIPYYPVPLRLLDFRILVPQVEPQQSVPKIEKPTALETVDVCSWNGREGTSVPDRRSHSERHFVGAEASQERCAVLVSLIATLLYTVERLVSGIVREKRDM